jgi:hypothetical protein
MPFLSTDNIKIACAVIATTISAVSFFPYLKDIFRKKTKPHSYTWLTWTLLQVIGVLAMYNKHAYLGLLALAVGAVFCGFIFILSLKYGTKNITAFDTICLIGVLGAIIVYLFLNNLVYSVILITIIDLVGFLPTLRKAYIDPYSETLSLFVMGVVWSSFNMVAISPYAITTTLYPAFILFANALCCLLLWARRRVIKEA